jgi:GT2 family glycosyltransferase
MYAEYNAPSEAAAEQELPLPPTPVGAPSAAKELVGAPSAAKELVTTPVVSVIIPSYNRYEMLIHAVRSVCCQTYGAVEVIVVDDCSTDPRYLGLPDFFSNDPRVRVIRLPENQRAKYRQRAAQGMTRNHGMREARGEYIAFLDDDDLWMPGKLDTQMSILRNHPDCLMIASNMLNCTIAPNGRHVCGGPVRSNFSTIPGRHVSWSSEPRRGRLSPTSGAAAGLKRLRRAECLRYNFFPNSTVVIHRTAFEKAGEQRLGRAQDYEYWKRVLQHTDALLLDMPTAHYCTSSRKFYS